MSFIQLIGRFIGEITGQIDIIRRGEPIVYRYLVQIVTTIISLIYINITITRNIRKYPNYYTNLDILTNRFISIPISIVIGYIIGIIAEIKVWSQLEQSRQNCLYQGYKESDEDFKWCVDETNFDLQTKNDIISRILM